MGTCHECKRRASESRIGSLCNCASMQQQVSRIAARNDESVWRWNGVGKDCGCFDERSAGKGVVGEKSVAAKSGKREEVVRNLAVRTGHPAKGNYCRRDNAQRATDARRTRRPRQGQKEERRN